MIFLQKRLRANISWEINFPGFFQLNISKRNMKFKIDSEIHIRLLNDKKKAHHSKNLNISYSEKKVYQKIAKCERPERGKIIEEMRLNTKASITSPQGQYFDMSMYEKVLTASKINQCIQLKIYSIVLVSQGMHLMNFFFIQGDDGAFIAILVA